MRFEKRSVIRASPERVFEFHEQPDVLALLIPPWESARVIQPANIADVGSRAIVETRVLGPLAIKWVAEHTIYDPPRMFEDLQVEGPFRSWRHRHFVRPDERGAVLHDEIEYEPPFGFVGRLFSPLLIERRLQKLFNYRHEVTRLICEGPQASSTG
jgi:ligand-binding SRPBCC domain-containing protein